MKTRFSKILSAILAVLVVIACASVLFACHKDKNPNNKKDDSLERTQSVANVKQAILHAVDEDWSGELDDDNVVLLDNAGDYVVAEGWANFICDVFKASALQTGKLKALDTAVSSEDGQKLLADFGNNFELLIPIMRSADFTPTDISNLFYDLLCSLVSSGENTLNAISDRLGRIKDLPSISVSARENVQACSIDIDLAKSALIPNDQEKQAMLTAFANAKEPISELVEFAYNISIGTITDNVFDVLFGSDGALNDISDEEIRTVVNAVLRNLTDLKAAFDETAIANMNTAMELVIANFDKSAVTSSLYQQVVQYAKYTYKLVGIIPVACDVLYSAGGILADTALLGDLKDVVDKDLNADANTLNLAVMTAKVLLKIGQDFTKEQLISLINQIGSQSEGDYQKKLPMIALDLALNLSAIFGNDSEAKPEDFTAKHTDIIQSDDFKIMIGSIFLTLNLDNFKQTYAKYKDGTAQFSELQQAARACDFDMLGIQNIYDEFNQTTRDSWYQYYVITGVSIAQERINAVANKCIADLKAYADDFYAQGSESKALIQEIANIPLAKNDLSSDDFDNYGTKLLKSEVYGIVILIELLSALV